MGAILQRNVGGRRSGIPTAGALHNQDMWYWMDYYKKQREQQATSLQQPIAMPTQQAMQQQPLNVEQVTQQQQQGLAIRPQNVPHYFF